MNNYTIEWYYCQHTTYNYLAVQKKEFNKELGQKLRYLRKTANKSQKQVGADFFVSQDTISKIEMGQKDLNAFELQGFARYYEKPITFFFLSGDIN